MAASARLAPARDAVRLRVLGFGERWQSVRARLVGREERQLSLLELEALVVFRRDVHDVELRGHRAVGEPRALPAKVGGAGRGDEVLEVSEHPTERGTELGIGALALRVRAFH